MYVLSKYPNGMMETLNVGNACDDLIVLVLICLLWSMLSSLLFVCRPSVWCVCVCVEICMWVYMCTDDVYGCGNGVRVHVRIWWQMIYDLYCICYIWPHQSLPSVSRKQGLNLYTNKKIRNCVWLLCLIGLLCPVNDNIDLKNKKKK